MKKIIEYVKQSIIIITIMLVALCAFGGGIMVFGMPIVFLFKLEGTIAEIIIVLSIFVPMPFCFWLAPKLSDKYL